MRNFFKIKWLMLFFLTSSAMAGNNILEIVDISKNIKAIVGPITNRTTENLGNNATFGLIITKSSAVLIDSGGSYKGAKSIHNAIKKITNKPIKFVINTGGQDHRWFGNSYFRKLGAKIISSEAARKDHKIRLDQQWDRLEGLIGKKTISGTTPEFADITFDKDYILKLDNTIIEIHHRGQAHTPGDSFVWLPKEKVMFTGDIVYLERMLGVGSQSNSKTWLKAFNAMATYKPKIIVPGHGHPSGLKKAKESTYEYLNFIRNAAFAIIDNDGDISELKNVDQSQYKYLFNFDSLSGRNIQKVFTEIEFE